MMMNSIELKRILAKVWPASRFAGRKVVLLYHSVGNGVWSTDKQAFADQINWLNDHCEVLSLTKLMTASLSNRIQVAITFDDGYANLYDIADRLKEKNFSPTLYLNTGWIGEEQERKKSVAELGHYPDEMFLLWKEVIALHAQGWTIGSHGVNHYDFTRQSQDRVHQELSMSKIEIEKRVGGECIHFSYPWGRHSALLRASAKSSGYRYAVAGCHGAINAHSDLFALPRINIDKNYRLKDFKEIIQGKWDYLKLIHQLKGLSG